MERSEAAAEGGLTGVAIRPLAALPELKQAVALQQTIWGFADAELIPLRVFVVATKIGGQVFGAFDGEKMAGFCLAIPGLKQRGGKYLHSHMLGVLPEYRNRHIGRALKLAQREDAIGRRIKLIEWTFDPLEIKNAHFNLLRLGAVVRRYVFNQYGITASPLHGGLPTDRCVAEWWLESPHAQAAINGRPVTPPLVDARVEVPANIDALRRESPAQVRAIQEAIGKQFSELFARRLAVVGFERTAEGGGVYLFGQWLSA